MSTTLALSEHESAAGADDFAALERRVLRMIDLLKMERQARTAAEGKLTELREALESQTAELLRAEEDLEAFKAEREQVRTRVERLLKQVDEITG
ncbi:MAG TPA: hypothetical protein VGD59_15205 [Acidisarcina sp.]